MKDKKDQTMTRRDFVTFASLSAGAAALASLGGLTSCEMVDNSYGAIGSLRHVGFIVKDGDASVNLFKTLLNLKDEDIRIINVPDTLTISFVSLGSIELELFQPISDDVKEALGNPSEGINHLAFNVTDIEESLQTLKEKGIHPGHITPEGAVSMGDKMIAYLDPSDTEGILIELVESL